MRKTLAFCLVFVSVLLAASPALAFPSFPDLRGHWSEAEVLRAAEIGFVRGYPDGSFRPESPVTRAEYLKMLAGALKFEPEAGCPEEIPDAAGHWLSEEGWLLPLYRAKAVDPGELRPDEPVTRLQAAVWAVRAACPACLEKAPEDASPDFTDAGSIPERQRKHVWLCVKKGIIKGYPNGEFKPRGGATRAEAVAIAFRAQKVKFGAPVWSGEITGDMAGGPCGAEFTCLFYDRTVEFSAKLEPAGDGEWKVTLSDVLLDEKPVKAPKPAVVSLSSVGEAPADYEPLGIHPASVAAALLVRLPEGFYRNLKEGSRCSATMLLPAGRGAPREVRADLIYQGYHYEGEDCYSAFSVKGRAEADFGEGPVDADLSGYYVLHARKLFAASGQISVIHGEDLREDWIWEQQEE